MKLKLCLLAGVSVFMTGCITMEPVQQKNYDGTINSMSYEIQSLKRMHAEQRKMLASLRADYVQLQELVRRYKSIIEDNAIQNKDQEQKLIELVNKLSKIETSLDAIDNTVNSKMTNMESRWQQHNEKLKNAVKDVSREISEVLTEQKDTKTLYTVVSGDTLSVIAKAYGVSVNALRKANNLDNDLIRIGQELVIPAGN